MNDQVPDFAQLSKIEEEALFAKLEAVRKTIAHAGEKGRALEYEVIQLLSSFLPSEYGLSTGFIAYSTPESVIKLSSQLDIIIYDALRGVRLARLGSCDVFPLESVYGYVEVKASLKSTSDDAEDYGSDSIEKIILNNIELRTMRDRSYYNVVQGTVTGSEHYQGHRVPIRAFVLAFEGKGSVAENPDQMAARLSEFMKSFEGAHIHGLLVGNSAFYRTIPTEPDSEREKWNNVAYTLSQPLANFRWSMLHSLSRFPRHTITQTPNIEKYQMPGIEWYTHPDK